MSEDQLFDRATGKSLFAALWSPLIEVSSSWQSPILPLFRKSIYNFLMRRLVLAAILALCFPASPAPGKLVPTPSPMAGRRTAAEIRGLL